MRAARYAAILAGLERERESGSEIEQTNWLVKMVPEIGGIIVGFQ